MGAGEQPSPGHLPFLQMAAALSLENTNGDEAELNETKSPIHKNARELRTANEKSMTSMAPFPPPVAYGDSDAASDSDLLGL